jgi:hypothetical protein
MFRSSLAYSSSLRWKWYSRLRSHLNLMKLSIQCYIPEHRTLLSHPCGNHMFRVENCRLCPFSGTTCIHVMIYHSWLLISCTHHSVLVSAFLEWSDCKCSATKKCVATTNSNSWFSHVIVCTISLMMWTHNLQILSSIFLVPQCFRPYIV